MASTRLEKPSVVRDEPLLWKATLIALLRDRPASTTLLQFSVQHLVSDMPVFCVAMQIALLLCSMVTTLVADAHAAGLRVHPWTYRAENVFVRPPFRLGDDKAAHGDLMGEIKAALAQGIDGFFTDFPLVGVKARDAEPRK